MERSETSYFPSWTETENSDCSLLLRSQEYSHANLTTDIRNPNKNNNSEEFIDFDVLLRSFKKYLRANLATGILNLNNNIKSVLQIRNHIYFGHPDPDPEGQN
jgi:hypothetical protein